MSRRRNPDRDKAKSIWLESGKLEPLKDIAAELGVSASTVRKWKSTDHWDENAKRSAPIQTERYDSLHENHNAVGNHGGAPPHNHNAVTHGLFAKWLPDETSDILQVVEQQSPADIIWQNITLQYTAIIRAQQIMYVNDHNDLSDEISGSGMGTTYDVQYAWDKQATFMAAQSRAMGTLGNLIKQFVAIADENDIRRKRIALMEAQVDKAKAEVAQLKRDGNRENMPLPTFVDDVPEEDEEEIGGDGSDDDSR
ncbi:TerS [Levilactobacillus brevis]|uniref:TerS n=1 Tax=Levilactobacillus brevis TaxID=1580 RepID=A0AA41ERA8_LEVBR|nr:phage terminase small subunit [Levilactobacillus brevis]MBS0948296.1 TerS [Levilactobacillus brevis]MBS1011441.1 TerS [Levilactobacillus brevis]